MITPKTIHNIVEKEFAVKLASKRRLNHIVHARWVYFKLAREFTPASLSTIGKEVKRDHATVLHGLKYIDADMRNQKFAYVAEAYERLKKFLLDSDKSPVRKNLVDLHEIKEQLKALSDRVSVLEYEKGKSDEMVKDQITI